MIDNKYVYAFMAAYTLILWLVLLLIFKSQRKAFLFGLLFFISGPICEFLYIPEYWTPSFLVQFKIDNPIRIWQFGIEDFISGFAYSGICFGVFELLHKKRTGNNSVPIKLPFRTLSIMILLGSLIISVMYFALNFKAIDSINLGMFITALSFYLFNQEYLKTGILTAVIITISHWLFMAYICLPLFPNMIGAFWKCDINNSVLITGVPLDEMLWAASSAFLSGPVYRIAFCNASGNLSKFIPRLSP